MYATACGGVGVMDVAPTPVAEGDLRGAEAIRLDIKSFLERLAALYSRGGWTVAIDDRCIHLWHGELVFSPLTAVYYDLTGEFIHWGSFRVPELTNCFAFPWWEVLAVSYASIACDCAGHQYNRSLRNQMLKALGQPIVPIV